MVKPGYRIHFGLGCGSVVDIDEALAKRADELRDVEIVSTVAIRKEPFKVYQATTSMIRSDLHPPTSAHLTGRCAKTAGAGIYRCYLTSSRTIGKITSAASTSPCSQVAPMDKHGNFNLGPQVADMWGRHQSGEEDHRRSKRKYADCPRPPDTAQSVRHRLCRRRIQLPYSRTSDKTGLRNR